MDEIISMAYGNGGKKTSELIEQLFMPSFNSEGGDGAVVKVSEDIAFSTDSFVIYPYFFPGGDIGKLSVCGTVNDLLMCGSIPKYISLSLIIEEGFKISELEEIVKSIAETAEKAGVKVVTGDTKVVDKGHGHGIYINTAGIGDMIKAVQLGVEHIKKGDKIIVSGTVGDHGIAILCARENILQGNLCSDCAALNEVVATILKYKSKVKVLRDPTRGGVATTLNEFTEKMEYSIELLEEAIPVNSMVKTACDMLGLDPLYIANEGKVLAVVSPDIVDELIMELRRLDLAKDAAVIGEVVDYTSSKLVIKGLLGGKRILDKLTNDALPRIC